MGLLTPDQRGELRQSENDPIVEQFFSRLYGEFDILWQGYSGDDKDILELSHRYGSKVELGRHEDNFFIQIFGGPISQGMHQEYKKYVKDPHEITRARFVLRKNPGRSRVSLYTDDNRPFWVQVASIFALQSMKDDHIEGKLPVKLFNGQDSESAREMMNFLNRSWLIRPNSDPNNPMALHTSGIDELGKLTRIFRRSK